MSGEQRMEAVDFILNIIKEHERQLESLTTRIENLVALKQRGSREERDWR